MKRIFSLFVLLLCMTIGVTACSRGRNNNGPTEAEYAESGNGQSGRPVAVIDSNVYYDDIFMSQEEFSVRSILGQTNSGNFVAFVSIGRNQSAHLREADFLFSQSSECIHFGNDICLTCTEVEEAIYELVLVDSAMSTYEPIFTYTPWVNMHFSTMCENDLLHILGTDSSGVIYLYIYDLDANLINQYDWSHISMNIWVGKRAYIVDDNIVLAGTQGFIVLSKDGNIIRRRSPENFYASTTVSGGYFIGVSSWPINNVIKVDLATGNVVWDLPLHYTTGEIWDVAYCASTGLVYLFRPDSIHTYCGATNNIQMVRDLNGSDIHAASRQSSGFHVYVTSFTVISPGVLHLAFDHEEYENYLVWVLNRYEGDAAEARQAEIAQARAERPILRMFDYTPDMYMHTALMGFARRANIGFEFEFITNHPTHTFFVDYIERLSLQLFSGMAVWDIVNTPLPNRGGGSLDILHSIERGVFVDILPYTNNRFQDNEIYFSNIIETLTIDGGLYVLPLNMEAPVVFVPNNHPDLENLQALSQNWTWADFLSIVREMEAETGIPPISAPDAVIDTGEPLISAVTPFYIHNENILFDMDNYREDFAQALQIYKYLTSPKYNHTNTRLSTFTFARIRWAISDPAFIDSHTPLALPTIAGERPLYMDGYSVLSTGEATNYAVEFLLEFLDAHGSSDSVGHYRNPFTVVRPSAEVIEERLPLDVYNAYAEIVEKVNTLLLLPSNVSLAISVIVEEFIHDVIDVDAAVSRIADIMWLYINE